MNERRVGCAEVFLGKVACQKGSKGNEIGGRVSGEVVLGVRSSKGESRVD